MGCGLGGGPVGSGLARFGGCPGGGDLARCEGGGGPAGGFGISMGLNTAM